MEIIQGHNDTNHYRAIMLDNQLPVLCIHQPKSQKSAATLVAKVGQFDDPDQHPGLAHFLEHMLFLGTKRYNAPDAYSGFIAAHGGRSNAWTGMEFTSYHFDIQSDYFRPALDRFSAFFCCPTFDPDYAQREIQTIDAEFKLKLLDDSRRIFQVHKETVNPAHPFSRFSVGNKDTLIDTKTDSICDIVATFYQNQYSANRMTLALYGPQSPTDLEALARDFFSPVENKKYRYKRSYPDLYRPEDKQLWFNITPVKETRRLSVVFPLPNLTHLYEKKPLMLISSWLGHEGSGSLLSYLRHLGWANQIYSGTGLSGTGFQEFKVQFALTPKGEKHTHAILEYLFAALVQVKRSGIVYWRFEEHQKMLDMAFHFQQIPTPLEQVKRHAMAMHSYPIEHVLYAHYAASDYCHSTTQHCLAQMIPENARVFLISPNTDTNQYTQWYNTPYSVHKFHTSHLDRWLNPIHDLPLRNPSKNIFIHHVHQAKEILSKHQTPQLIKKNLGIHIWHLQEHEFQIPKGNIFISVDSEYAVHSVWHLAATRLAVALWLDHLNEAAYPAQEAGIYFRIYTHQGGYSIHLSGFSTKQKALLEVILQNRTYGDPDPQRFKIVKQQLIDNLINDAHQRPINQMFQQLTHLLQPNNPPSEQLLSHLVTIQPKDMRAFFYNYYKAVHVEMLVHGDWSKQQALDISELVEQQLLPHSLPSQQTCRRLISLHQQKTWLRIHNHVLSENALLVYYQSARCNPEKIAYYRLVHYLMNDAFFHQLRTEQQLGYIVGSSFLTLNRHPGLVFYVQSPKATPEHLLTSIESFIHHFPIELLKLTQDSWETQRNAAAKHACPEDTNIDFKSKRFWNSLGNGDYAFNHDQIIKETIFSLTKKDIIAFITNMHASQSDRLILYSLSKHAPVIDLPTNGKLITDVHQFKLHAYKYNDL